VTEVSSTNQRSPQACRRGLAASISKGREPSHPAVDRHVVNGDAALNTQLLDVSVGQPVAQLPAHLQHDDLTREAKPSEARPRRRHSTVATTHLTHQHSLPQPVTHQRNSPVSNARPDQRSCPGDEPQTDIIRPRIDTRPSPTSLINFLVPGRKIVTKPPFTGILARPHHGMA